MSSAAYLTFDDGEGPTIDTWNTFADTHDLRYNPHVIGHNVYRHLTHPIEVAFGQATESVIREDGATDFAGCRPPTDADRITFSTYFMNAAVPDVAALAVAAWQKFGGRLSASPEVRARVGCRQREDDADA